MFEKIKNFLRYKTLNIKKELLFTFEISQDNLASQKPNPSLFILTNPKNKSFYAEELAVCRTQELQLKIDKILTSPTSFKKTYACKITGESLKSLLKNLK